MRFLLAILLVGIFSSTAFAEDDGVLSLIANSEKNDTPEAKVYSKYLSGKPAEKNIFLRFVREQDWRKCLYQWEAATTTSLRKTTVGKALFSYVLLKNNMPLTGIELLVSTNPKKIPADFWPLLRKEFANNQDAWLYIASPWNPQWRPFLSKEIEVLWRSHTLVGVEKQDEVLSLMAQVPKGSWAYNWLVWQSTIGYMLKNQNAKASKNLSYLMKTKKTPISIDLLNMTAARLLYEEGYLKAAQSYYEKISHQSDFWAESIEERAWQSMRSGKAKEAQSSIQPLLKSSYIGWANTEVWYLKALSELRQKDFESLDKTQKAFSGYSKKRRSVLSRIVNSADTDEVNNYITKAVRGQVSMAELGASTQSLPGYLTRDLVLDFQVKAYQRFMDEAKIAKDLYQQSLSQGTFQVGFEGFLKEFQQTAQGRSVRARNAAMNRVKKLAHDEIKEIGDIETKFTIVQAEMSQLQIN